MRFVFDLDGVLVDSHKAVRTAYRKAGQKMPDDAWGKPWHEWTTKEVHDEKVRIYPNILREHGRLLPACELLKLTNGSVLTSASAEAVQAVSGIMRYPARVLAAECSADGKIAALIGHVAQTNDSVMYFDDDKQFGLRAAAAVPGVTFAHATQHDGVYDIYDLSDPTRVRVQKWTLSSWLLAATSG